MKKKNMLSERTRKKRVACIGDSITFGWGLKKREKNSYPAILQRLLGSEYNVKNFGNSGRCVIKTAKMGKEPRSFHFMKEHKRALNFNPHIVLCNLGINDLLHYNEKQEQFIPDYKELLLSYLNLPSKPKVIVWQKLAPVFPGQLFYNSPMIQRINNDIYSIVNELKKEGATIETLDMAAVFSDKENLFFKDKLHPNQGGVSLIAHKSFEKVELVIQNTGKI